MTNTNTTARKVVAAAALLFGLMGVARAAPVTECERWADMMTRTMDAIPARHAEVLKEKGVNLSYFATGNVVLDELSGGAMREFYVLSLHKAPECTLEQEVIKNRFNNEHSQSISNNWGR